MIDEYRAQSSHLISSDQELIDSLGERLPLSDFQVLQKGENTLLQGHVTKDFLWQTITQLRDTYSFIFLLDIMGRDTRFKKGVSGGFEISYLLLSLEEHQRFQLIVALQEEEELPSVSSLWTNASLLEFELYESLGVRLSGSSAECPFPQWQSAEFYPLRKDYDFEWAPEPHGPGELYFEDIYGLNFEERIGKTWCDIGLLHPATNGGYRVMAELEGERVCRSKIELGYNYRGVEKKCEMIPLRFLPDLAEEMSSSLGISHGLVVTNCIEESLGIQIPDRAQALRMILLEMERIHEHCLALSRMCQTIQHASGWEAFLYCREMIEYLLSKINQHPLSLRAHRFGGVSFNVNRKWIFETLKLLKQLEGKIDKWHSQLTCNNQWMERTDIGHLSAMDAVYAGLGGPLLRSCGVNYDLRKVSPCYFYHEVQFDVPLGINGRVYDRYLVMIEEIRQSLGIIQQLLDNLPQGDVLNKNEERRHVKKDWSIPKGGWYSSLEGPLGELGVMIFSEGGTHAERVKFRSPSLAMASVASKLIKEEELDDALVVLSSLSMNMGELDR